MWLSEDRGQKNHFIFVTAFSWDSGIWRLQLSFVNSSNQNLQISVFLYLYDFNSKCIHILLYCIDVQNHAICTFLSCCLLSKILYSLLIIIQTLSYTLKVFSKTSHLLLGKAKIIVFYFMNEETSSEILSHVQKIAWLKSKGVRARNQHFFWLIV